MKRLINILFVSISTLSLYAQDVVLPVPPVNQIDMKNWCWAASISAIAQYYQKPAATLYDVLERARLLNPVKFGDVDCHSDNCPLCHQTNVLIGDPGSISDVLTNYGINNNAGGVPLGLKNNLAFEGVKSQINLGKPILATWYFPNSGGGHAVVITGYNYNNNTLWYMDPASGVEEIKDYSWFLNNVNSEWYGSAYLLTDPPYIPCTQRPSITGSTMVCSTSNYTFTVNNFCPGSTISWSVLSGSLQLISSAGNTAVFRGLTGASGPGTIQAAVTSPSGTVSNVPFAVWVGTPSIINVSGPRYTQVGASTSYCATLTDAGAKVTSYNWSLMPGTFNNYFNPGGLNCYITWYKAGEYMLQVNAQNSECGTGATYYYPVTVGLGGYLSLSPNPASNNVQASVIKARDISTTQDSASITASKLVTSANQDLVSTYTVRIYNGFGTLIYSIKKSGNEFTIPVNNLKDGTYIVEANDGNESYKQQLIVKH